MSSDTAKRAAAAAAIEYLGEEPVVGFGTGSTVNHLIELLAAEVDSGRRSLPAAVSSSQRTTALLLDGGFAVLDLNDVPQLAIYVDGADEFEPGLALTKGGGAALTGEKIVATAAQTFICIVDDSKRVDVLGGFPLPVEVIPMAHASVARQLRDLGGDPKLRQGLITEYGNVIFDVHGLRIVDPLTIELEIEAMPGVVTCGIFAQRRADLVLMGSDTGVREFR